MLYATFSAFLFITPFSNAFQAGTTPATPAPPAVLQVNPPRFGFFAKLVDCDGIAVRGSAKIQDSSLLLACSKIRRTLKNAPAIRQRLAAEGAELQISALGEQLTMLPGHELDPPRPFSEDVRRGDLYGSCSEKNLLAHDTDGSAGTGIDSCMVAFTHPIYVGGLADGERLELIHQFQKSIGAGLWKGESVAASPDEYFIELTMWYFGGEGHPLKVQKVAPGPDALRDYDPGGFALLDKFHSGKEQPPTIHLANARRISSAENVDSAESVGSMIVANDTKEMLMFTRVTALSSAFAIMPGSLRPSKSLLMPFDRVILPTGSHDIWVISDLKGREFGRWKPLGQASILHFAP